MQTVRWTINLSFIMFPLIAGATGEAPQSFTLDGKLYKTVSGTDPLVDPSISITIDILNPNKDCILYQERQIVNTSSSAGAFNIEVGSPIAGGTSAKRTGSDSSNSMTAIFQNVDAINGKLATTNASCTYTPTAGEARYVRVHVNPSTTGIASVLSPDITVNSVPTAMVAENLNGVVSANILQADATTSLNQTNLASVFSNSNYPKLTSLLSGGSTQYVTSGSGTGASLPSYSSASPPSTPAAGSIWYDSTAQAVKLFDGSTVQTLGVSGGSAPTGGAGGDLGGSYPNPTVATVGTSTASNIHAAELLANSATNLNTSSMIVKRDGSGNFAATQASLGSLVLRDTGANTLTLQSPAAYTSSYAITLPAAAPTVNGQVLAATTAGVASWYTLPAALPPNGSASGDLSGSYPGPTVSKIQGNAVSATTPTATGQVYKYTTGSPGSFAPGFIGVADIRSTVAGNAQFFPTTCTASQTLVWDSPTDKMNCTDITVTAANFANQTANTVLAGPASGGAAAASFRTLASADLPKTGADGAYVNGGNSFGQAGILGTNDSNVLSFETNNTTRMTLDTAGYVGIGTTSPAGILDVRGGTATGAANGTDIKLYAQNGGPGGAQNGGHIMLIPGTASFTTAGTQGSVKIWGGLTTQSHTLSQVVASPWNNAGANTGTHIAAQNTVFAQNTVTDSPAETTIGTQSLAVVYGAGGVNLGTSIGSDSNVTIGTAGKLDSAIGVQGSVGGATNVGTIVSAKAGNFSITKNTGAITTGYGVYVGNVQATTPYSVYASDASAPSYFAGSVGIGTTSPAVSLDLSSKTDAIGLPSGNTAAQPSSPVAGMIRYNSQTSNVEFYNGSAWTALSAAGGSYLSSSGGTVSGALTISSGGASVTGGIDNNSGGITEAGSITGVGANLTGAGAMTVAAGGTAQNLTLNSSTSGSVNVGSGNGTSLSVLDGGASTVNYITARGAAAGSSPIIGTAGSDTNINLTFTPKGSGNSIFSSGKVGIGTASPAGILEVQGGTAAAAVSGVGISLTAQSGGTGNTNGGDIVVTPGLASGSGTNGNFQVVTGWGLGGMTNGCANNSARSASFANGCTATASGDFSFASGQTATASGAYSSALGPNVVSSGTHTFGVSTHSDGTTVSGNHAAGLGWGLSVASYGSLAVGRYNVGGGTSGSWVATDPLFEIGNGTGSGAKANAVTVLKNGSVGIGTSSPSTTLNVVGSSATLPIATFLNNASATYVAAFDFLGPNLTTGQSIYTNIGVDRSTNNSGGASFYYAGSGSTSNRYEFIFYGGTPVMSLLANGKVGIGTTSPAVSLDLSSKTDAIGLPSGNTAAQPSSPVAGMIRYNSQTTSVEFYNGSAWTALSTGGGSYLSSSGGTISGALTISSGGASVTGGIDNNSGGITEAGSITGVGTNLTGASAMTVAAGGTAQNLTLSSSTSGSVNVGSGNGTSLSVLDGGASTVNYITARGAAAGSSPVIGTAGSDTNINLTFTPKGSGNSIFSTGNVGIGTTSPGGKLVVTSNTSTPQAVSFATAQFANADTFSTKVAIDSYGSYSNLVLRSSNGTAATPSALATDDGLGTITFWGYGTNAYASAARASITAAASQSWTNSAQGTYLKFQTTAAGTTTTGERMRIAPDGKVGIGTTSPDAALTVTSDANSYSIANYYGYSSTDNAYIRIYNDQATNPNNTGFVLSSNAGANYVLYNNPADQFQFIGHSSATPIMTVGAGGNVGIGTTSPSDRLAVELTPTTTAGSTTTSGITALSYPTPAASSATDFSGVRGTVYVNSAQTMTGTVRGVHGTVATIVNGVNDATLVGVDGASYQTTSGAVDSLIGVNGTSIVTDAGATTTTAIGGAFAVAKSAGTIGSAFGVYIGSVQGTSKFSLYTADPAAPSYFSGSVGIGTTSPGTTLAVSGSFSIAPVAVSVTSDATLIDPTGRSYISITSSSGTAANRTICLGAGTLGQRLIIADATNNDFELLEAVAGSQPCSGSPASIDNLSGTVSWGNADDLHEYVFTANSVWKQLY